MNKRPEQKARRKGWKGNEEVKGKEIKKKVRKRADEKKN
jgi:hypothetical protein